MSGKWKTALAVAVLAAAACSNDSDYNPGGTSPTVPVATTMTVSPDSASIQEFDVLQLDVKVRDQSNQVMLEQPTSIYSTSDINVATVSQKGFIRAVGPGRAIILVTTTLNKTVLADSTIITVYPVSLRQHPVLDALTNGWSPNTVRIAAGDGVEWHAGFIATSGVPVHSLYLWKSETPGDWDEVTFADGVARRTFATPGTYVYCSNACWDPPEYGTIIVEKQ